jgi:cytoskeleton protein RodZ
LNSEQQRELIPMELGDVLRHSRKKRGWTLAMLAEAIKVRPEILAAIETGETGHIPSVYLKGYIRSYARQMGVAQDSIEQQIADARGVDPVVQPVFKEGLPRKPGDRWFKASSYVMASAVVIALVWQFTNEAVRFSQGDPLLRPAQSDGSPSLPAQAGENSNDVPSNSATAAPAKTHMRASIASMNMAEDQAGSTSRPLVAEGAWAAIGNRDAAAVGNQAPVPVGAMALEIITSADSWVEIVDRNGEKIEMDLLRAGSRRTYNGAAPFHLLLGRASSVELFHYGEKVDLAPHTRGNVARLTLGTTEDASEPAAKFDTESSAMDLTPPGQG